MKKRSPFTALNPSGILRISTLSILASSAVSLTSCDNDVQYTVTEQDAQMAEKESKLDEMDKNKETLTKGEVGHNFYINNVGYYHARVRDFFEFPHGYSKDGKYYIDGQWSDTFVQESITSSRPTPEALRKVENALAAEQAKESQGGQVRHHNSGFGFGNALMMYWLLSGNRGSYNAGPAFMSASRNASTWQNRANDERRNVTSYAASNSGYASARTQSKSSGAALKSGQTTTIRGGFGSSSSRSSSFGS